MRAILAIAAILVLAASPAFALRWSDTQPCNPLALPQIPPPPTDADLARREAAAKPGRRNGLDNISDRLGFTADGRQQIFRYQLNGEPDSGVTGFVNGGGATLELRW